MKEIIHPELSYKITGLCFKTQKELGRFCRERQYADFFEKLLRENNIGSQREFEIKNLNQESPLGNRVDFLIENIVLVDFKAKNYITKNDYFQMQRYLRGANLKLGIVVNFREAHLKPKRVVNSFYKND